MDKFTKSQIEERPGLYALLIEKCERCAGEGIIYDPAQFWAVADEKIRQHMNQWRAANPDATEASDYEEGNAYMCSLIDEAGFVSSNPKQWPPEEKPCSWCGAHGIHEYYVPLHQAVASLNEQIDTTV